MTRWHPRYKKCAWCGCTDRYERPFEHRLFGRPTCVSCVGNFETWCRRSRTKILHGRELAEYLAWKAAKRAERPEIAKDIAEEIQNGASS
jgi:hypothetical protein